MFLKKTLTTKELHMADTIKTPTAEMTALLRKSGSQKREESLRATAELAVALLTPLREGVLSGDITGNIYENVPFEPGVSPEFPLDLLAPSA